MSAGNYGKAFAFTTKKQNIPATVCMPDTAPMSRAVLIEVGTVLSFSWKGIRQGGGNSGLKNDKKWSKAKKSLGPQLDPKQLQ